MALCRKSEGDVYIFSHVEDPDESYRCFQCELTLPPSHVMLTNKLEVVKHLELHQTFGHKLPKDIWKRVKKI